MAADIAEAFYIIFYPLLVWLAAASTVGGVMLAIYTALLTPIMRRALREG